MSVAPWRNCGRQVQCRVKVCSWPVSRVSGEYNWCRISHTGSFLDCSALCFTLLYIFFHY